MRAFLEIVILIGITTLISMCVMAFKSRKLELDEIISWSGLSFVVFYYGVLSVAQVILGNGKLTLRESYTDISMKMLLVWMIGIILCGAIFTTVMKACLHDKYKCWLRAFATLQLVAITLIHLVCGEISNYIYTIVFLISIIFAFWQMNKKQWSTMIEIGTLKERIRYSVPIIFFYIILVVLYTPFELYMTNITEFSIELRIFLGILLINSVAVFALLICGCFVFNDIVFDVFYAVIFAFTCMGYVQGVFLNGLMQPMEGAVQTWNVKEQLLNGGIWIVFIVLIIVLKYRLGDKAKKIYSALSVYISLMLLLSGVLIYFTTDKQETEKGYLITEGMFELHEENNVIIFILDFLDTQILENVCSTNEDILQPLEDFVYYPNMTSRYAFTGSSVPYLLSGIEAQNPEQITSDEYWEYASDNNEYLQQISKLGYDIGIYTEARYIGKRMIPLISNYSKDVEKEYFVLGTIKVINRTSKYKMLPFVFKNMHWYSSGEINNLAKVKQEYICVNDVPFYNQLVQERIRVGHDSKEGTFKFYHLYGAHAPFVMNENLENISTESITDLKKAMNSQTVGALKIVYEYIEQLKENDLYDSATIIITADHGHSYLLDEERLEQAEIYGFKQTSNPILFIKAAKQSNEKLQINTAPISHSDIHATVIDAMGGNYTSYGKTIWEIQEDEIRDRRFLFGKKGMKYREFSIQGDVRDENSWTLIKEY